MLIDTHIHLDDTRYDDDIQEVLDRAREAGVTKFIIPGADPKTLTKAISISEKYDDVYFAIGVHPYDANNYSKLNFEKYINHKKCIAIGECGLDYFRLEGTQEEIDKEKKLQKSVFISQINLAKKYNKPLIIHIRDASVDSKKIILENEANKVGGVLHCFNADEQLLSLANDGFYFGIGGVLTFKNAKKLLKTIVKIPRDKILIETDGPYLTPTPHRGERNEPLYTIFVAEKISEILDISIDEVKNITTKNSKILFQI